MVGVAEQILAENLHDQLLVPGEAVLQNTLNDVVPEAVAAELQGLCWDLQHLIHQQVRTLLCRAEFQQAANDAAPETMSGKSRAVAQELFGNEAGSAGAELCHHLLQDEVGVWRRGGFADVAQELQRQCLANANVGLLKCELHQAAALGIPGKGPHVCLQCADCQGCITSSSLKLCTKLRRTLRGEDLNCLIRRANRQGCDGPSGQWPDPAVVCHRKVEVLRQSTWHLRLVEALARPLSPTPACGALAETSPLRLLVHVIPHTGGALVRRLLQIARAVVHVWKLLLRLEFMVLDLLKELVWLEASLRDPLVRLVFLVVLNHRVQSHWNQHGHDVWLRPSVLDTGVTRKRLHGVVGGQRRQRHRFARHLALSRLVLFCCCWDVDFTKEHCS
mmetsp:Transcript_59510/g.96275  ORF Transcript_59510/g.96275 Transcript_59510/m.96275 type:complete len:390 (-) Transcript_59510:42-1211(-)